MGTNTKISWTNILGPNTGSSWNPIQARNKETHKRGWACVKVSEGCKFCYAEHQNATTIHGLGTGLAYTIPNLQKIQMELSLGNGQTGIDWPLRAKKSQGIFPCSMTDWLGFEFVPVHWSNQMLSIMLLAQHHIFLPLTKRWDQLEKMLTYFTKVSKGMEVPDHKVFDIALLKARANEHRWQGGSEMLTIRNSKYSANVPWPPPNIFFGISICTRKEAEDALPILRRIKDLNRNIKTWVSYEPALEDINWISRDYNQEMDWLVVGGESGKDARPMLRTSVGFSLQYGLEKDIPVYVKQLGSVWAKELGLDPKGTEVPSPWASHQFPDIERSYIPWR